MSKKKLVPFLQLVSNMEASSAAMEDVAAAAWQASVAMRTHHKALQSMFAEVTVQTGDAVASTGHKATGLRGVFETKLQAYAELADLCHDNLEGVLNEISFYRAQIEAKKRNWKDKKP
jgi:hypothetical protein